MNEVCELLDEILTISADDASDTLMSAKSLLHLPDDLLLPILVHVPLSGASLIHLRLVCRRIRNLTKTRAYYHDVAQTNYPDTAALFFSQPQELDLRIERTSSANSISLY